jgi:hypothetical protein
VAQPVLNVVASQNFLRFVLDGRVLSCLQTAKKQLPFFPEPSSAFPHRDPSKTGAGQGF